MKKTTIASLIGTLASTNAFGNQPRALRNAQKISNNGRRTGLTKARRNRDWGNTPHAMAISEKRAQSMGATNEDAEAIYKASQKRLRKAELRKAQSTNLKKG